MDKQNIREIRIDPIVPALSVLISTARGKRPRKYEPAPARDIREHVTTCPFCRGNEDQTPPPICQHPATGEWDIRVVENLYPILDDDPLPLGLPSGIQQIGEGYGHHEIIIDHFNHGIALHQIDEQHLTLLFTVYQERMRLLYNNDSRIRYVLVFKNFGKAAGGSIPHTHSQLIAMPIVPHNVQDEVDCSLDFYQKNKRCVFCTLIDEAMPLETTAYDHGSAKKQNYDTGKYFVERGKHFIAIKPFANKGAQHGYHTSRSTVRKRCSGAAYQ